MARPRRKRKREKSEHGPGDESRTDEGKLALALEHHRAGRYQDAERLYAEIHRSGPPRHDVTHLLGLASFHLGKKDVALQMLRLATELDPGGADAFNDLGNVLLDVGELDDAERAYRGALAADARHVRALTNLGIVLKDKGLLAEAVQTYRSVIRLDSGNSEAYYNLGIALKKADDLAGAADALQHAVDLAPEMTDARQLLCGVLRRAGRLAELRVAFDQWLEREPSHPVARHMRSAMIGEDVPSRASNEYVRSVFDRFAARFDQGLALLEYDVPVLIGAMVERVLGAPRGNLAVLDAGCGTGLCGIQLRPFASRLDGVDLSSKMLAMAGRRGIYDRLEVAELTEFMSRHEGVYDVAVAGDTFNYFGDLPPLLACVRDALCSEGHVFFTLEIAGDESRGRGFQLQSNGRYRHDLTYVKEELAGAELQLVDVQDITIRKQAGDDVKGILVGAVKGPSARR
jgi:predicted TPR repeat methyltransferase